MFSRITTFISVFIVLLVGLPGSISNSQTINADLLTQEWKAGWIRHPSGSFREFGVYHFRKSFTLDAVPAHFVVHVSGIILRQTGRLEAALSSYDTAIALLPENAEAHGNRGNALLELKRPDQALASYDTAIALQPNYAEAHKGRGNALVDLERLEGALSSYDQAIALQPDYAEAYSDRGRLLRTLQRPLEALSSFNRAIALKPADPATYLSRGELLRFEGRTDEAVASLEAGLAVDKLHGGCRLGACLAQLPIIYGSEAEVPLRRQRYVASLERLAAAVAEPVVMRSVAGVLGIPPFYLPYQGENDVAPQALYGQMACRILAETLPPAVLAPRPSAGERIRLGIVSGYFNSHTVFKLFLEGWLTELDRDRFEVTGFYTGATSDDLTALAAGLCDRFVQNLPSAIAWREAISATAPNVLLYPEIGMDPMVGWLAPQRLAPVQCVSVGTSRDHRHANGGLLPVQRPDGAAGRGNPLHRADGAAASARLALRVARSPADTN